MTRWWVTSNAADYTKGGRFEIRENLGGAAFRPKYFPGDEIILNINNMHVGTGKILAVAVDRFDAEIEGIRFRFSRSGESSTDRDAEVWMVKPQGQD